ncbi:oligosaccharide flippase family protein, partial [Treponema sp. JC4]|uniref:oligosaccharide flippase family protein n=1 Tax=Treponema sp. JC4 TaxID=1124982 RepID=UPI00058728A3
MKEKSIALNAAFNSLHKVVNLIFPVFMAVYVSHILLAEGIGRIGIAQNLAQYFVILAPLGIPNYGTREIAKARENIPATNKLFTELLLINSASTFLCLFIYYGTIIFATHFAAERLLYIVCGIP